MKFKFAILFLAVLVFGSITLAYYQGGQLEGNLSKSAVTTNSHVVSPSILHVSSNASQDTDLYWSTSEVDTLGQWKIKADENLTINGINFHVGEMTAMGNSDTFLKNFFAYCDLTLTESGKTVETYSSDICLNSYTAIPLEAGKTYTLTLTASPASGAWNDFYDGDYDGKQVALTLVALTPSNGIQVKYNSTTFPQLVEQKASVDVVEAGKHVTIEYTFGGYNLVSQVQAIETQQDLPEITAQTELPNQTATYTKTNTYTSEITNGVGSVISSMLSLNLGDTSKITEELTITVTKGGSSIKISNGSSTKTCTSTTSGLFTCQLPE